MRNLIFILTFVVNSVCGQIIDDFSDNDFTNEPQWVGDGENFEVLMQELHLNAPAVSGTSYIASPSQGINEAVWEFYIRFEFNPSSSNFAKFYLVSDSVNLAGELHGYFVKVGSTADDISLYRQDGNSETLIINGEDGKLNFSLVEVNVRVTRDDIGNWDLLTDVGVTGVFSSEGQVFDDQYVKSLFGGLLCNYTSTRSDKFYLDDVIISGDPWVDLAPPQMTDYHILTANSILISFDEPVLLASAISENFTINSLHPNLVEVNPMNQNEVVLTFDFEFMNGFDHTVNFQNVSDTLGNSSALIQFGFLYFVEMPLTAGDVIINEFFPDPSPVIELPESEFVELYNISSNPIQLNGWTITDGNNIGTLGSYLLLPDSMLILCPNSYYTQYETYGSVLGVSPWPTQNNSGDLLVLKDPNGLMVDSIYYMDSWYKDAEKESGGFTLEKINPEIDCNTFTNWHASNSQIGGTPGRINSIFSLAPDNTPPQIIIATFLSPYIISLTLDEPLTLSWEENLFFAMQPQINVDSINYDNDQFKLTIYLSDIIGDKTSYSVQISGPDDCSGNKMDSQFMLVLDYQPPSVDEIEIIHPNELLIRFDEPPLSSSLIKSNFGVDGVMPVTLTVIDSINASLEFDYEFINLKSYDLEYLNLKDFNDNVGSGSFTFTYPAPYEPEFLDLIVTEIMINPEPGLGILPLSQYVEIFNASSMTYSLKGITLSDGNSFAVIKDGVSQPGEYILLTPSTQKDNFFLLGQVIGLTSWPSFNQTSDEVTLKGRKGKLLHSIIYSDDWYKEFEKQDGGWSLEIVDFRNPCGSTGNWSASEDPSGGTPILENSIAADNTDHFGPELEAAFAIDSATMIIQFNEPLNPNEFPDISISPSAFIESLGFSDNSYKELILKFSEPLQFKVGYHLSIYANDCLNNLSSIESEEIYLPEESLYNDLVINEILFNPKSGGNDFVELYNRSQKHLLIKGWSFFSYTQSGKQDPKQLTDDYRILRPKEFLVLTSDQENFLNQFPFVKEGLVLETQLPPLPNELGSIIFLNEDSKLIDSVYYHEDWHHPLLETVEGVSLERLSTEGPSTAIDNWKSASSGSGFSTPGRINSQIHLQGISKSEVEIFPELFFPGTGGLDSFATIEYTFEKADLVGSLTIFSSSGVIMKRLASNQLLGTSGFYTWDGTDEKGNKVSVGHYFVVIDLFAPSGYIKRVRKKVAVGVR